MLLLGPETNISPRLGLYLRTTLTFLCTILHVYTIIKQISM